MNTLHSHMEGIRNKINERRKSIEQVRSFNVRRIQTDVQKITKQEIEFTKKMLEQMIPIKLVWNEDATKRLRDMVPFTVELTRDDTEDDAEADVTVDASKQDLA